MLADTGQERSKSDGGDGCTTLNTRRLLNRTPEHHSFASHSSDRYAHGGRELTAPSQGLHAPWTKPAADPALPAGQLQECGSYLNTVVLRKSTRDIKP